MSSIEGLILIAIGFAAGVAVSVIIVRPRKIPFTVQTSKKTVNSFIAAFINMPVRRKQQ